MVGNERTRTHARTERAAGFSAVGAAWSLKPLRTDSVSRGLSISLFTRVTIFFFFFILNPAFLFMKRPFF